MDPRGFRNEVIIRLGLFTARIGQYRMVLTLLALLGSLIVSTTVAQNTPCSAILTVYNSVENIIFILGLTLMILGGALYAGSHLLPTQTRGQLQGYGMGMIIGGVIGVIIVIAAPYILDIISPGAGNATCSTAAT